MNKLLINADDFGNTASCTGAILEAFRQGLITDTTMMANGGYFDEAVRAAKDSPLSLPIGIHFVLTEGTPLTEKIKSCPTFVSDGKFHGKVDRLHRLTDFEKEAVYEELTAQAEKIRGAGIDITHADSHHHIHTGVFLIPTVLRVCREQGIGKIRIHRNVGKISLPKRMVKKRFNRYLAKQGMKTLSHFGALDDLLLCGVPADCELMVHPDYDREGRLIDREDFADGFPVGRPLSLIRSLSFEKNDYRSI